MLIAHKVLSLDAELSGTEKRVAAVLIDSFNRKTGQCDPGLNRIASLLSLDRRTVKHRLRVAWRASCDDRGSEPRARGLLHKVADYLGQGAPGDRTWRLRAMGGGDGGHPEIRNDDKVAERLSRAIAVPGCRQSTGRNHDPHRVRIWVHPG
jgi:hypothetical protein